MSRATRTQILTDWTCDKTGIVATTTDGSLPAGWAQVAVNDRVLDLSPVPAAPFIAAMQATVGPSV